MKNYLNATLGGRYRVLEIVGSGGMAQIYKAYDSVEDRTVALKILNEELIGDTEVFARFRNEASVIACLSHPNIVKIYDYSFEPNLAYFVMEYVDGISLDDYMKATGAMSPKEAIHFVIQILRALQHTHDEGIYHLDIKPANVMVLPNASVKVSDFGVSKPTHGRGIDFTSEKVYGSVRYMSPEQICGDDVSARSDIYSVGVLLYELVTGRLPFDSASDEEVAYMQINYAPERPMAVNPNVPLGIEQIILKAMQKNPDNRYSSASDFLLALYDFKKNPNIVFDYVFENTAVQQPPVQQASGSTKVVTAPVGPSAAAAQPVRTQAPVRPEPAEAYVPAAEPEYEEEDDDDDDEPRRSMAVPIIIASVVAVLILAGIFVLAAAGGMFGNSALSKLDFFGWFQGETVEVPNFVGMQYEKAQEDYPDFNFKIEYEYNTDYEVGQVCGQDPDAGKNVNSNTVITLKVAASSEMVRIQDATEMTIEEAEALFKKDGFVVELVSVKDDSQPLNTVIYTTPSKNSYAPFGSTVYVYYASDKNSKGLVTVPDLYGYNETAARQLLSEAGLTLGSVTEVPSTVDMKGVVITQSPGPNASVKAGTTVDIAIGSGVSDEDANTASFSVTLPTLSSGTTGNLVIYLNGSVYDTVAVNLDGGTQGISISGQGADNTFEIKVNGSLLYSGSIDFTTSPATVSDVETYQFTSKATVPSVVGSTESEALDAIKSAGFTRFNVVRQSSDTVEKGVVISQTPDASSRSATSTLITIVVSSGPSGNEEPTEGTTEEPVTHAEEPSSGGEEPSSHSGEEETTEEYF